MGRRRAAQRRAGGGDGIQAPRPTRARLILALLSAAVYAGIFAYVVTRDLKLAPLTTTIGTIGSVLLLYALVRRVDDMLPWPILFISVAYAIPLFVRGGGIDDGAPLVAAGLLLTAELAAWSFDERWAMRVERAVYVARGIAVGLLVLAALAASALVLALAAAPVGGGLAWTVLGAAAAVVVVGLAARLGR
jgi:hypothetical protein